MLIHFYEAHLEILIGKPICLKYNRHSIFAINLSLLELNVK